MAQGVITKALSGFYYIADTASGELCRCKAKGRFRHDGTSPLVGDRVEYTPGGNIAEILPRRNSFIRPAVANADALCFVACGANPVTDPFLPDRVSVIAENAGCDFIIVFNKADLDRCDALYEAYSLAGFKTVRTSAVTGEGIPELREALQGRITAFTGNSGAGKSSLLNCLCPGLALETAAVSEKLGRGVHTTRHTELFALDACTFVADTPGFASFEVGIVADIAAEELPGCFREFAPFTGSCRFADCRHLNEPGCAVKEAVGETIPESRYASYARLYDIVSNHKSWE